MLGALVWGDGRPLTLSLDRADLWDLRPVPEFHSPEYTYAQMVPGIALASVQLNDGATVRIFVHATEPVGLIRVEGVAPEVSLGATAELADEAGLAGEVAHWRNVLGEFPDFARGADGRLLVTRDYPLPESRRHLSHLMAIHPLGLIDWEDGPDARQTIRASLDELERMGTSLWCGYSFAWLASQAARAPNGDTAEKALEIFATAFTLRNSFHCNGDQSGKGYSQFTYDPFTLEGNFAAAAGAQEMLLQSQRDIIRLFPAVPDAWRDVSFTTLRAEGAFLVSAQRVGAGWRG